LAGVFSSFIHASILSESDSVVKWKKANCRVANKVGILCAIKVGIVRNSQELRKTDFSLWNWLRQGHAGPLMRPDLPYARLLAALRLRPRRALSSAEAPQASCQWLQLTMKTIPIPALFQL
jgi:hypothetical protein